MLGEKESFKGIKFNWLLNTDSYKASHWLQYPPKTRFVNSYIESRGGRWNRTVFFGLQAFLLEYMTKQITKDDIDIAEEFWNAHGEPFNREGWEYILLKHSGFLPVEIKAVPEGTVVPTSNVLVQIINTDPEVPWLTSYLETALARAVWYPTTVCTQSWMIKKNMLGFLSRTSDNALEKVKFMLHDFGARGASSLETASLGGCAHLVNFLGSDTVSGVLAARAYYNERMAGFSIPASEHSTITVWGGPESEINAFENMLNKFGGLPLIACVSDSFNIWEAVETKWPQLKEKIINSGSTLVVRPDSGNPVAVVSGVIGKLMDKFGFEVNRKGFKVLPPYIRVIQGDGVNEQSINDILLEMECRKFSADNISFGMGAALLQNLNRDNLMFAMKASAAQVDGVWRDVYKAPITDPHKNSKKGVLALVKDELNGGFRTIQDNGHVVDNQLRVVYSHPSPTGSPTFVLDNFSEIRERAHSALPITL